MPKFIVKNLKTSDEQEYDLDQATIILGRTNTCDIELNQKSVSRRHAQIISEDYNYYLSDLGSGNGSFLNNKKIPSEEKQLLGSGDVIRIEDFEIRFILAPKIGDFDIEENTDTDILEIKLIKKMMRALDQGEHPSVEFLNGPKLGEKISLSPDKLELSLGRGEDCDIVILDQSLSRVHAKLEQKWGGVVLSDLDSKNGSFVNKEAVTERLLHDGDRLMVGNIKMLYRNPQEVSLQITHHELQRKKREAAMHEAEQLAKQREEEEVVSRARAAQEQARRELEARELEAQLKKQQEEEEAARRDAEAEERRRLEAEAAEAAAAAAQAEALAQEQKRTAAEKPGLSGMEKALIGVGGLVLLTAVAGIIWLFI